MNFLLSIALKSKKHLLLFVSTLITLILLVIASQLEVFALGVLSNKGADFFTLFSTQAESPSSLTQTKDEEKITLKDIEVRWPSIDTEGKGYITKQDASSYLGKRKDINPLNWAIDKVKTKFSLSSNVKALLLTLLGVALFKAIWLFASRYTTQLLSIRISRDLRQQYFEHIQSLPMSFYQQHNLGSLSSRAVGDAGQIAASINSFLTNYIQTPFTIVTCLSACFFLSWKLSLVIFVGVPLIVVPVVYLARRVKRVSRQLQVNQEKFASVLLDFLAGIQTVKIFAMETFALKKYKEQNDRTAILESKIAKYGLLVRPILHAVTTLCLALIVVFGLYALGMSLSQLIVFCALLQLVYEPIKKFADENTNIQRGVVAAERMFEVLDIKTDIKDHPHAIVFKTFEDAIEFKNVWFRYQEKWVLRDLSFKVKKGQTVAVVGPTGAGKSTIVQLIPRLYDVEQGQINIDGIPITGYTLNSLREKVAFVSQKPFLFCDTVAANIAVGKSLTLDAIVEAARNANADEFISVLPEGYNTMMAEGGQNFSGGQQQRLAIARALAKKSPILILDEATSALDAISENKIKEAILALRGKITQIIIAHRLSTIEHADVIIYLENGEKIAEGTKDELLQTCRAFKKLWQTHFSLVEDDKKEEILYPQN